MIIQPMNPTFEGVATLTHLGVIRARGADAVKFLQGQLTQDFALLPTGEARLAAFCSAKGRMQASFIGFKRAPDEVLLICNRDLLAATLKRLSMFVMRAKLTLSDASGDFQLLGLAGNAIETIAMCQTSMGSTAPFDVFSPEAHSPAPLIMLHPAGAVQRALWVLPVAETSNTSQPKLSMNLSLDDWLWGDVRSGVATLSAAVADAFVPQMLNFESVGGVNFKKGCYPGQEVVARSQFRGTIKRRGVILHGAAPMVPGTELFQATEPDQPCGIVAQSAPVPAAFGGGFDAIASCLISAAEAADMRQGAADGPPLTRLPLPYALLDDI